MVSSTAQSPDEYIAALPPDRREAISAVRDVVRRNLPDGFEEGMEFGMIDLVRAAGSLPGHVQRASAGPGRRWPARSSTWRST